MQTNFLSIFVRFVLGLFLCLSITVGHAQTTKSAYLLKINGPIGPATQEYVRSGIKSAVDHQAAVIILQMDTPGGLDIAMRAIIQDILSSPIPIVTYVAPSGARAASAGMYILYASHIAAMAPGTNLGAATPIKLGEENNNEKTNVANQKMTNDAVGYVRSLAELRGRNADWAELAVRNAVSISANQALQMKVIEVIANNVNDLLTQINGKKVSVLGQTQVLNTAGLSITNVQPNWRIEFLSWLTNPSVAYILLMIGIYGLLIEFAHPGIYLPGVVGVICLLLAFYAFQMLPVNYVGITLIAMGIAFLIAESFIPAYGSLGIGGIIAFIIGSIMLIDTSRAGFGISKSLIFTMAAINVILFFGVIGFALRSRRARQVSGREGMLGMKGNALEDFTDEGWVKVQGENWRARTTKPVSKGQAVKIVNIDGLVLWIEPV